jgi:hypothetical protein
MEKEEITPIGLSSFISEVCNFPYDNDLRDVMSDINSFSLRYNGKRTSQLTYRILADLQKASTFESMEKRKNLLDEFVKMKACSLSSIAIEEGISSR